MFSLLHTIIIIIIIDTIFSTQWYTTILMSVSYLKPQICFHSGLTNRATLRRLESLIPRKIIPTTG